MHKTSLNLLGLLLACAVTAPGPAAGQDAGLGVRLDARVVYECDGKARVMAGYYSLSDGSLHFVTLSLPDGRAFTLPRVLSASGVRYTDDVELLWWTKGDGAFAEQRGPDGQWQSLYEDCRTLSEPDGI